jgi:dienelactone hydrolase
LPTKLLIGLFRKSKNKVNRMRNIIKQRALMKKFSSVLLLTTIIVIGFVFILRRGTSPRHGTPKIVVTPENALLDEPIEIVISNFTANAQVTIEASIKDKGNNVWISRATFQADDKGVVNVAKQASISGSYLGIDPIGLFWSMSPTIKHQTLSMLVSLNLIPFELSIFSDNKLLTQKTIYRRHIAPNVEKKEIREQGIVGTLFYPKGKKSPGVMIIPGSSGQLPGYVAQLLASHGYTVFETRYFGQKGLPKNISLIPLEYFKNAMQWFKKQPQVDENKIALMGQSTGGELVLLLASTFPGQMNAVIALSAPSFILGAWTYKNKPLPFISLSDKEMLEIAREGSIDVQKGTIERPLRSLCQLYLYEMKIGKFKKFIKEAMIPVENIRCPLLILSGDKDTLWPCSLFGKNIMERLDLCGSKIKRKFINYLNAGNNLLLIPPVPSIDLPFQLADGSWSIHGGSTEGNAHAHKEAWQEILNFLKQRFKL